MLNKGDLLFDPCFGSGSALLCAMELGKNYLGCEINKKYFDIAKERLGV